jgi:Signal transduction histidine kinase
MRLRLPRSIRLKSALLFAGIICGCCLVSLGAALVVHRPLTALFGGDAYAAGVALLCGAFTLCALVGSGLVVAATGPFVRPIRELGDCARRVASGDFDARLSYPADDELGELVADFNAMAEGLGSMEYLRKDFVSGVSHEFRTPLSSIRGFAQMLRDGRLAPEKADEYIGIILDETERLDRLASNMLRLSRLDSGAPAGSATRFLLDEQIRAAALLLEQRWASAGLELELELPELEYEGDEELTQQIWLNLIDNAIKFSRAGGRIRIAGGREGGFLVVAVEDEGIGIAPEDQARVFERFYQCDASRSRGGNGLGLPIVKRIVQIAGGSIRLTSELGAGTRVSVSLPSPRRSPEG